ncbi:hypothetical protein KCP71_22245 [Salmonella enterica subsp. enterica]|nr:hypothetical protein KCP71_22245 [Salmonella enterica subsp. enterica]
MMVCVQLIEVRSISSSRVRKTSAKASHLTAPRLALLDGDAMPIPVKLDILAITSTAKVVDYEMV